MKVKYLMVGLFLLFISVAQMFGRNIYIESVNFQACPLPKVIKQLQKDYQVNLVLQATKKELAETPLINLHIERVRFYTLLHYICMLSGMAYEIDGELTLVGRRLEKSMPLRAKRLRPNPSAGISSGTSMNVGSTYYMPIAWAPGKITIVDGVVTRTSPRPIAFTKMNTGLGFGNTTITDSEVRAEPKIKNSKPEYRKLHWRHSRNSSAIAKRLRRKTVALELEDASLKEAIAKIRQLSSIGRGKNKKYINFIIIPFSGMVKIKISCYFNSLDLLSSLKYICKVAKVKYQLDRHAVIIYRVTAKKKKR